MKTLGGSKGLPSFLSSHPDFIMPPSLGFYVAVGTPYDLYRVKNNYYVFHDNAWYRGTYYNGPWRAVNQQQLPQSLRRHNHEQIRAIRDEEYRHYRDNRDSYRGKHFKPDKAWKEQRKADKKQAKHEKKQWKEERRDDAQIHAGIFGLAVIFLQIAILLSSIAALMKKKVVWVAGVACGAIGLVYFANGFLLFF